MSGAPIQPPLDPTQLLVEFNHYGSLAGAPVTWLDRTIARLSLVTHRLRSQQIWDARVQSELEFVAAPDSAQAAFLVAIAFGAVPHGAQTFTDEALATLDRVAPSHAPSTAALRAIVAITQRDRASFDRALRDGSARSVAPATLAALESLAFAVIDEDPDKAGAALGAHGAALDLPFETAEQQARALLIRYAERAIDPTLWQNETVRLGSLAPNNIEFHMYRARTLLARQDGYNALAVLEPAISAHGSVTPSLHALRGRARSLTGDNAGSQSDLDAVIDNPAHGLAPRELALCYEARAQTLINTQRQLSAAQDLTEAIKLWPKRAQLYLRRANAYASIAKPLDAARDLETALELSPLDCNDPTLGEIATHYFNGRRYDLAERAYARATRDAIARKLDNNRVAFLEEMRGAALHFLRRYDDAIAAYDTAIALLPSYGKAYSDRGEALLEVHRDEAAFADLERALLHNYRIGCTFVARATYFQRKGDHDRAITELDEAARLWPTSAQPLELRAKSHEAKGDARRAADDRERAAVLRAARRATS
ncbi:MAG: tetratricopeptide repeat protein [Polyangiales bacterium]